MRGLTPAVPSPYQIIDVLPGLYQDDPMARSWTAAFDDLLAPVFLTLDNLAAYLDPDLAPADFLEWLAGWVGVALDPRWPPERRRAVVAGATELYRWRGTGRGIADAVELVTGVRPEVVDSGGVTWSATASEPTGTGRTPSLTVRLPDGAGADLARQVVELARPAHVPATVEVVTRSGT